MSTFADLGNAVVTLLNGASGGTFTRSFTAARTWLVDFDVQSLSSLRVSVLASQLQSAPFDRGRDALCHYTVEVLVQQKTDGSTAQIDAIVAVAEEIFDFLREQDVPAVDGATTLGWQHIPVLNNEALLTKNVATSVVIMTYGLQR